MPTQLVERPETVLRRLRMKGREVPELFARRLHGRELFGHSLDGFLVSREGEIPQLFLLMDDPTSPPDFDVDTVLDGAAAASAEAPEDEWEVVVVRGDRRRLAAAVPVAPLGAAIVRPVDAATQGTGQAPGPDKAPGGGQAPGAAVVVSGRSISNGLVSVDVAPDGTLTVQGGGATLRGVGRLVDGGDFGDTYNYGSPAADRLVDGATGPVIVSTAEIGPVRGSLEIVGRHDWPVGLTPDGAGRSESTAPVEVTTTVELRADEPFVRLAVAFTNPARDHRVRWHVPLPAATDRSAAEGQFAVVERGLTEEAGHGEVADAHVSGPRLGPRQRSRRSSSTTSPSTSSSMVASWP